MIINLALNYAHSNSNKIFKYISSIKGCENFLLKCIINNAKAYQTLGLIRQTFKINCIEQLYLVLVRLQISYCSQFYGDLN